MNARLMRRFNNDTLAMGYSELLDWFCSQEDYIVTANQNHWTIVGEWTSESSWTILAHCLEAEIQPLQPPTLIVPSG